MTRTPPHEWPGLGGMAEHGSYTDGQALVGPYGVLVPIDQSPRGRNRGVENDSVRGYELYVGINQEPDFSSSPAQTSGTLPFDYTPGGLSDGDEVHCVLRYRNGFNVSTSNTASTIIRVDGGGDGTEQKPAEIQGLRALVSGWELLVLGEYLDDGADAVSVTVTVTQEVSAGNPAVQTGDFDLVEIDTVGDFQFADGIGKMDAAFTLDDDAALPDQTGVVTITAVVNTTNGTTSDTTTITASAPGDLPSPASAYLFDDEGMSYAPEEG